MRVETIGNATLYLGDCVDVMAALNDKSVRIDAVITDPPYGVRERTGTKGKERTHLHTYSGTDDSEEYIRIYADVIQDFVSLGVRCAVTCGAKNVREYPPHTSFGGFYQPAASSIQMWGFLDYDPILFYGRDPRSGKTLSACTYRLTEAPQKNGHPCPRPIKAWTWLVNKASTDGETVLDPFMGSGTTGVACANLGRNFIGIEIEPKYFDIACERITNAYRQERMFA